MSKRVEIVDLYGQKLTNSGYRLDQMRRAMVGGLVRYERRLVQSRQNPEGGWRPLHEGAKYNARNRRVKKMLAKTNWYKRKRDQGQDQKDSRRISVEEEGSSRKKRRKEDDENVKPDGGEKPSAARHNNGSGAKWSGQLQDGQGECPTCLKLKEVEEKLAKEQKPG